MFSLGHAYNGAAMIIKTGEIAALAKGEELKT